MAESDRAWRRPLAKPMERRKTNLGSFVPALVGIGVAFLWAVCFEMWRGSSVRWTRLAISAQLAGLPYLAFLASRRLRSSQTPQFSLNTLLIAATYCCLLASLVHLDRQVSRQGLTAWKRIELQLQRIIGEGNIRVCSETLIQVKRPTFGDCELRQIVALDGLMTEHRCPIAVLDLAGTQVTDEGIETLEELESLQFCFLDRTALTDRTLRLFADGLPRLQVLSCGSTKVTDEALLALSRKRPRLNIEPKSYVRLTGALDMPPSTLIIDPN